MKTVSLYKGQVEIDFDEARHCYSLASTGAKPDGVTTILGLVPKYLLPWCARETAEYFRSGLFSRMERGESISELSFINSLYEEAKKAHTKKRDTAGDIGSFVHDFAEKVLKTGRAAMPREDAPEFAGCQAFLSWLQRTEIDRDTVQSERIVFSRRLFYAGTCDCFAAIRGRPTVIDFKTGSGFYEDQPLQLAAYALALEEELGVHIRDGWIIHLDKQTGKMTPYYVPITDELKTDWEAVRIAWRAVKRNQERHAEIRKAAKEKAKCLTSRNTFQAAAQL